MADEQARMSNYLAEDIVDNIDEVRTARGEYDSLDDRLYGFSTGKQDKLSATNKLSVAFVDFTPEQIAALDSGITSEDVEQIETNKNNILFNTNNGVKNLCKPNVSADSEVTYTVNADNSITITCNTTALREVHIFTDLSGLTDGKDYILSGCNGGNYSSTYGFAVRTSGGTGKAFESDGETTFTKTAEIVKMDLIIRSGQNWTKTFYPMIRPASISDPTYQPYALSNAELTYNISLLTPQIVSTDITELAAESYADGTVCGYANSFAGLSAAWVVVRTYTLNREGSRKMQIVEAHTGNRKTRFFNGAWGAWS